MKVAVRRNKAGVLLDRDGTLIVDSGYVGSVDDVQFFDGRSGGGCGAERRRHPGRGGDQPGRCRPRLLRPGRRRAVHAHIDAALAEVGGHVDQWLYCPYHPDGVVPSFTRTSGDRKPAPGMALAAAAALDLDLHASWVVGDADTDVSLALAVGARPIRVGTPDPRPDVVSVPDLTRAVRGHPESRGGRLRGAGRVPAGQVPVGGRLRAPLLPAAGPRPGHGRPLGDWIARPRSSTPHTTTATRCSPAATAARPRSPTTSSATTSRGFAWAPTCGAGAEPQYQHGAVQRDRERPRVRRGVRVPAPVPGASRRRADRDLLVGQVAEHHARARVGRCQRSGDDRAHRVRRPAGPRASPPLRSTSTRATTESSRTPTRPACTCSPSTCGSRGCPTPGGVACLLTPVRPMRVAINLLTDDPAHPSGAHWFWTRVIPEMA